MMRCIMCCLVSWVLLTSCEESAVTIDENSLQSYLNTANFERGAVIACAASAADSTGVLTFFYPEPGALNSSFFETETATDDPNEYANYTRVDLESIPFFNGYLRQFTQQSSVEKWIIVAYELEGEIKISNPIRTKQVSKPTVWNSDVNVNFGALNMPIFTWQDNATGDNAIYFQVISDIENNLLSGTYTYENQFQYYDTENVVLNITTDTPPMLSADETYNFTLMDVSEDNWVNLVILADFIAK